MSDTDDEMTQQRGNSSAKYCERLDNSLVDRMIKDLVRLALNMETKRASLTKEDALRLVFKEHRQAWGYVFEKTQQFLRAKLGMELVQLQTRERKKGTAKLSNSFILRSILNQEDRELIQWKEHEESELNLLMVVLSLILGHGRTIPEETLKTFLNNLGVEMNGKHEYFGSIQDCFKSFISLGYLGKYKLDPRDENYVFVWGPRSKALFTEKNVIEFMVSVRMID